MAAVLAKGVANVRLLRGLAAVLMAAQWTRGTLSASPGAGLGLSEAGGVSREVGCWVTLSYVVYLGAARCPH